MPENTATKNKHAVPKNLMDIEFKLFGSLTVRQFTNLAVSFIIALILYVMDFLSIARYPLIVISIFTGLSLAFLQVNERPFSVWLSNFIKSLVVPQRRVYHKGKKQNSLLTRNFGSAASKTPVVSNRDGADSAPHIDKNFLRNKLRQEGVSKSSQDTESDAGTVEDIFSSKTEVLDKYFTDKAKENVEKYNLSSTIEERPPAEVAPMNSVSTLISEKENVVLDQTNNTQPRPMKINKEDVSKTAEQPSLRNAGNAQTVSKLSVIKQLQANQVAGFVTKKDGNPLDKAQVYVKDTSGKLLRSAYSDTNGKFIFTTVLPDGEYLLEISYPGESFPEFKLQLKGQLVPMYRYPAK